MTTSPRGGPAGAGRPPKHRVEFILACLTVLVALAMVWGFFFLYRERIGPAQPIHFSHRIHATVRGISCLFCHPGAMDTPRAGMPPVETCLLCHSRIIVDHPEIRKLRAYYDQDKPVEWVRVNSLPDFVYFDHEAHIRAGFDCGQCHGDVAAMDRVRLVHDFQMGFCIQCHRDNQFSHDCLICHR